MPKKKKETLVHLDMAELTKKPSNETEIPKDQTLGDILLNARKKKHLDIEDISTTLCIKPIYIEALEKEEQAKIDKMVQFTMQMIKRGKKK